MKWMRSSAGRGIQLTAFVPAGVKPERWKPVYPAGAQFAGGGPLRAIQDFI